MVDVLLGFDRATCRKCRDSRVLGVACPTCGAPPAVAEVNVQVQRRRRLTALVRRAVEAPPRPEERLRPSYGSLADLFRRVGDDLADLLAALSRASHTATPFTDADELATMAKRISATSASLGALERLRPFTATVDLLRALSVQNRTILIAYLDALDAPTPLQAQQLAAAAQGRIDEASSRLDSLNRVRDAAAMLEADTEPQTALQRLFGALALLYPGLRITQLEALGRAKFRELTQVEGASGTGVGALAMDLAASAHLDPTRFTQVLAHTAQVLSRDIPATRAVFADEQIRLGVRNAMDLSLEAYGQIALLFPRATSDDAALRQVLKLYKSLFEDVMAPLAATLLVATGAATKPYDRLIREDAAELARRVGASTTLEPVLAGVVPGYRNAESHGAHSFLLEHPEVVFSLRSFSKRVQVDSVLDDCFAMIESVMAVQLAVSNHIALLGYEDHQPKHLGMFQPTPTRLAELLLGDQGVALIALSDEGGRWAVCVRDQPLPVTALAAGLETVAPPSVEVFVIRNDVNGAVTQTEVDRSALREALDSQDDPPWATIVALAGTRVDGEPTLVGDTLRRAVAAVGIDALARQSIDHISRLRRVRALAVANDDQEAADLAVDAIRAIRLGLESEAARRPEWHAWITRGDLVMR